MAESDWAVRLQAGLALERQGRLAEAEKSLALAVRLAPGAAAPLEEYARFLGNAGRVKEALAYLRRCLTLGDRSLNAYLTAGRLLEEQGLLRQAESSILKGLRLGRRRARKDQLGQAHAALGRLHQRMGLLERARRDFLKASALSPRSASAHAGQGETLRRLGRLPAAEKALRRALRLEPALAETRLRLIETLAAAGRRRPAARELARLLSRADGLSSEQLTDGVARLAELGAGEAVLPVLLRHLRAAGGGRGWSKVLSAWLGAGRCGEAFALGEAMLDGFLQKADVSELSRLLWPWFWGAHVRRSVAEKDFCARQLERLAPLVSPWADYARAVLLIALDRRKQALGLRGALTGLPAARYFWMRLPFVLVELEEGRYEAAAEDCLAALAHRPDLWWARCRLAEARLAQGRADDALRELRQAELLAAGDVSSKREALTWHGEVLLWLKRYPDALAKLDEAVALGATTFVHGWRGAARLKLGLDAIADLDLAVARDAKDVEALVWRGEAKRLAGRPKDALKDLDAAIALYAHGHVWAHLNRLLVRHELGDAAGVKEDFACVPDDVAAWLGRKPASVKEMAALARSGLEAAGGIRRMERYLRPLWMGK